MKIVISNIDWDYPGKEDGAECPFPSEVTIDSPMLIPHLLEDIDGEAANLAEYLTSEYGCCVCGFVPEVITPKGGGQL